jgi:hypothetical protein
VSRTTLRRSCQALQNRIVGIRELKEHASALIRRVAAGEHESWWDRMVEQGRLIPARRDLIQVLEESPPRPLLPGERSPYDMLMELRADER